MGDLFLSSVAAGGQQDVQNTLNGTKFVHLNNWSEALAIAVNERLGTAFECSVLLSKLEFNRYITIVRAV